MNPYTLTLTLHVEAQNASDAHGFGMLAVEHLQESFKADGVTVTTAARVAVEPHPYVTRWVLTKLNADGMRQMVGPWQGRNTYAMREQAEQALAAARAANRPEVFAEYFGPAVEVRPCKCWAGHFDPVGIYFNEPAATV